MEEKSRLTIEEIKHCEKCSDICLKVAIIGSIFTGITFLLENIAISVLNNSDLSTLWKLVIGLSSTVFMGLGFASCEFSRNALLAKSDMDELTLNQKYQIYRERHDSK